MKALGPGVTRGKNSKKQNVDRAAELNKHEKQLLIG